MWAQTTSHQLWLLYKNHLIILRKSASVILFPLGFKFNIVSGQQLVLSSADTVWMSAWGEVTAAPHHLRGCCSSGTAAEERQWATQKAVMLIPALWIPSPARKIHQVLGRTEAKLAFGRLAGSVWWPRVPAVLPGHCQLPAAEAEEPEQTQVCNLGLLLSKTGSRAAARTASRVDALLAVKGIGCVLFFGKASWSLHFFAIWVSFRGKELEQ